MPQPSLAAAWEDTYILDAWAPPKRRENPPRKLHPIKWGQFNPPATNPLALPKHQTPHALYSKHPNAHPVALSSELLQPPQSSTRHPRYDTPTCPELRESSLRARPEPWARAPSARPRDGWPMRRLFRQSGRWELSAEGESPLVYPSDWRDASGCFWSGPSNMGGGMCAAGSCNGILTAADCLASCSDASFPAAPYTPISFRSSRFPTTCSARIFTFVPPPLM